MALTQERPEITLRFLRRKKNAAATGSRLRLPGDARESRTPASLPAGPLAACAGELALLATRRHTARQ